MYSSTCSLSHFTKLKTKAMTFKQWIIDLFKDERGTTSIKPLVAFIGTIFLCGTLIVDTLTHGDVTPSDSLVDAVMIITAIGMGADSLDKFTNKKAKEELD